MQDHLTIDTLDSDEQAALDGLVKQLHDRRRRNFIRAQFYDGRRAAHQVGSVIPPQYYRLGLVLGWSAKAVDLLARRCRLAGFTWSEGDLSELGGDRLWDENKLSAQFGMAVTSSLEFGPSFLVNTAGVEGEPESLIHVRSGLNTTGMVNPRTWRLDSALSVTRWESSPMSSADEIAAFTMYLPNLIVEGSRDGSRWEVSRTPHPWGVPVEAMVYRQTPERTMGRSRISRPIMSLHESALRAMVRLEGHMDVYSFPEMWMLGADPSMFKNADGSTKASWQVMLGRIKGIPDDDDATNPRADVKQFQSASPEPHLADLNALAKLFAREASLPDSAVAITDVSNPTSAESYDASQYELIAEAEGACDDWAPALERCFARALAIRNGMSSMPDEFEGISARWRDPRYLSRAAEADAGMKQISAVPWLADTTVGMELLGLSDQQIKRALAERRRQAGSALLERIGADAG